MKKALKIAGISITVLLVAMIAAPFIFKTKIINLAKSAANKQLNAKLDFDEKNVGLNLFRSFPNFSVSFDKVSIVGKDSFDGDTLCYLPNIKMSLDIMSVISGSKIEVEHITLDQPLINLETLPSGRANWDIAKPSTDTSTKSSGEGFKLALQSFEVTKGNLTYNDRALDFKTTLKNFDHESNGDFTKDIFLLKTETKTPELSLSYGGVEWLHKINTVAKADLDMDLAKMKFGFANNNVQLNALNIQGKGFVDLNENDIDCNIEFKALENTFKNFLSLIPGIYSKDFDQVQANGTLALNGSLIGKITDNSLPKTDISLKVNNGSFKYPSLQYPAENIFCDLNFINTNGEPDNTTIDIKKLSMVLAGEPLEMKLLLKTPISDPYIDAYAKGNIDLDKIKGLIPLEKGTVISGKINTDVKAIGNYSSAKSGNFSKLQAEGNFKTNNLKYQSAPSEPLTEIDALELQLSPQVVNAPVLKGHIGKNDFDISGKFENLIAYLFSNETLKGNVNINSKYFNVNDFVSGESSTTEPKPTDTAQLSIVELPTNLDVSLKSDVKKLIYDNLTLTNINGGMHLHEGKLDMQKVSAGLMGGKVMLDGTYDSKNVKEPFTKLITNVSSINLGQAFNYFTTLQKFAPIAKHINGLFNANIDMSSILNEKMQPNYNSMNVTGDVQLTDAAIQGLEILNQIGGLLKVDWLKTLQLKNQKIRFNIKNGIFSLLDSINIPLPKGAMMKLSGSSRLDQKISYNGWIKIPREAFGAANNVLNGFVQQAAKKNWNLNVEKMIPVDLKIGGTFLKPEVSLGLQGFKESFVNNLKDQGKEIAKDEVNKKLQEGLKRAREEGDKLKAEAHKRAEQIRAEGKKNADKARAEVKTRADQLRDEGAKAKQKALDESNKRIEELKAQAKDPLAKLAADKAATKLKQEADKKANSIQADYDARVKAVENEGNAKADKIESEANNTANKVESEANEQADKLLKKAEEEAKV